MEKREKAMPEINKTEEVFLLSYSPLLHDYALKQLVSVLQLTVTAIDTAITYNASLRPSCLLFCLWITRSVALGLVPMC